MHCMLHYNHPYDVIRSRDQLTQHNDFYASSSKNYQTLLSCLVFVTSYHPDQLSVETIIDEHMETIVLQDCLIPTRTL